MNDVLSLAVWAAILATPRTMHRWPNTEYTFQIWPGPIHPSISLIEMERLDQQEVAFYHEHGQQYESDVW